MRWRPAGSTCRSCRSTTSARSGSTSARSISQVESTYMVTAASGIKTVAEVDRAGVRVVGIANTTTIRAAGRTLEEHHDRGGAVDRRRHGDDDRRQGRRLRAVARFAAAVRRAASRLAHRRWRLPVHRRRHRGAEGQAGGAGLCDGVHGGGEEVRRGPPRVRRAGWRIWTWRRSDALAGDRLETHARLDAGTHVLAQSMGPIAGTKLGHDEFASMRD